MSSNEQIENNIDIFIVILTLKVRDYQRTQHKRYLVRLH